MGFFDDLVVPQEPPPVRPEFTDLGPPRSHAGHDLPPSDWFLPCALPQVLEAAVGPHVRVMLRGWSVWPETATLHLAVFRKRIRAQDSGMTHFGRPAPGALRVGLLLADGRRVTTLDGDPWPTRPGSGRRLTLRHHGGGGGGFHQGLDLYLNGLPPEGETYLVVEWPDEGVPETRTAIDPAAIGEAAGRAVEIWPGLRPPPPSPQGPLVAAAFGWGPGSPSGLLAVAGADVAVVHALRRGRGPARWAEDAARYEPRGDWEGMRYGDWQDLRLVRARLDGGADPGGPLGRYAGSPLHEAAAHGSPEVVAELVRLVEEVDLRDPQGLTPLWHAVCHTQAENADILLQAGAEAWRPLTGPWSPGRLALTTRLAATFETLTGAVLLTPEERAAQEEADRLIAVFEDIHTEGLGVAFVAGVEEEELLRRLGTDAQRSPVLDLEREPGPYGTGPGGFDPSDYEASLRFVGITGVTDGCVLTQPMGYLPSMPELLSRISVGTTAYGLYFNPKGGTHGTLVRDGRTVQQEEIGLSPRPDSPPEHWLFRFWQRGSDAPYGACKIAYACAAASMRIEGSRPVTGPPRRWAQVPQE